MSGTSTIGGVTGTITSYSGGTWTMTVHGVTFATGTYNCGGGGCTYMGAVVGSTKTFNFTTTKTGSTSTATGFSTHGAWVSTVAGWANSHLSGSAVGKTVSDAARIEGDSASGGHGDGDGHGGGGGHSK